MKYLFVQRYGKAKIVSVDPANLALARKNFYFQGYTTFECPKPPAERTVRRWKKENKGRALDGCWVNGLCSCEHKKQSWLSLINQCKGGK